jgi:para-aminobenzoate synthetase component 1
MNTAFCFYNQDEFLVSENYSVKHCPEETAVHDFLKDIEKNFYSEMKIVQNNFEYDSQNLFKNQKKLYDAPKACVFILKSYSIVPKKNILADAGSAQPDLKFESLESKAVFIEKVNIIKREIAAGRVYQVNLTAPLFAHCPYPAESVFKTYCRDLNGDYQAFLPIKEDLQVICFSPELFLQKSGNSLCTRPIKGSLRNDLSFESDLLASKKEEAELSMIVDLLRNDLNRIEPKKSAEVTKHRAEMQLGYIQHSYSEIKIETEKNLPDIINCTFPGGSISGCPKIESLHLISELEMNQRQIYTGSIGWWKENEFTLNLAIRTFIQNQNLLFYHAGCGIVFDSDAEHEWDEFILKTGKLNAVHT